MAHDYPTPAHSKEVIMEAMGALFDISVELHMIAFALKFQAVVMAVVGMLMIVAILKRR